MARPAGKPQRVERPLGRPELAHDLEPVLVGPARPATMARHEPRPMPAGHQRIRKIPDQPLATASLLGPENVAGKRNSDGGRIYSAVRDQTPYCECGFV